MRDTDLAAKPFYLDADAIAWVRQTLARLTPDDKIRQLFNLRSAGDNPDWIARQQAFRPGSVTRAPGPSAAREREIIAGFNAVAPTPLLVSADLEGSRMSLPGGTEFPNPLALAAVDDVDATADVSRRMAIEARAHALNWSFTPVLDINAAFRSAIVATRGFGSDVETIARHALTQIEIFQTHGIAATVKHWPGEGFDDRDQHLVTTVNPLSMPEWEARFGRLYRAAIEAGVMSVMSAHIALPAYVRGTTADAGIEAFRPASISRALTHDLLRGELGFNGLIVSDATGMAGLKSWSRRADYLPEVIAAGNDVILFADDPDEDYGYIAAALADGRLGWDRVDDAITRQLALKAALGLHKGAGKPVPAPDAISDRAASRAVTQRAPTLVKDTQKLLPLDPTTHKRVTVISTGIVFPFLPEPIPFELPQMLRERGFVVTDYQKGQPIDRDGTDLLLYLFGEETLLTRGHIFLDWLRLNGDFIGAMQRYWTDIPTAMVSFGFPYYLYDAPRVPTYINAYSTTRMMQEAVVEALLGKAAWNTHSPIDPFAGDEQARY